MTENPEPVLAVISNLSLRQSQTCPLNAFLY